MPHLVFCAYCFDPSSSHNYVINYGDYLNFIFTFSFFFEKLAFLHHVECVLVGIGKQIIGFSMCQIEVIEYSLPISRCSIS